MEHEAVTGGELISRILQAHKIGSVFAVAGASHTHLLDPLDRAGMQIISNRHEAGAVGCADGYARATGKPGVAMIVADQGLPNAIGALAVAWHALSPVLLLVATPPRVFVEADGAIDQDKLSLVSSISKWARSVPDGARLADYLETAIKHAMSGRRGPAVLLIPENLLQTPATMPALVGYPTPSVGLPHPGDIASAADLLAAAKRPLIVAGSGVAWSGAEPSLQRLASTSGIPVLMNALGRGAIPEDGDLGYPWPYAQPAAALADVVLVIGARLTQRLGLGLPPRFAKGARFIQIDLDPAAMHRNRPVDLAICADARPALEALCDTLEKRLHAPFDRGWVKDALQTRDNRINELVHSASAHIHPLRLGHALMKRMPQDSVIVADGADIATWMYGNLRIRRSRGFMDHYPMGAMGSGTALAIGAATAMREEFGDAAPAVVLVTGDGAIGFHPMELHAAVQARLKLLVVIGNDGAWGTEYHGQVEAIGRSINTRLGQLAYEKLGDLLGTTGLLITRPDDLDRQLDLAFGEVSEGSVGSTVIVNVLTDPKAGAELKVNPDVRMILFSDILSGQSDLGTHAGAMEADRPDA